MSERETASDTLAIIDDLRKHPGVTDDDVIALLVNTLDVARVNGFLACREAAAKVARPKETRPCDCDYCDCGNNGSARDVARWDAETYIANAIEALTPGER